MGIGIIFKNDPFLQLLGGGHGAQGNGNANGHVQLSFPMSPGDTVGTIADRLGLPLDSLLQVNPGMSANTPLSAGLTVQLPVSSLGDLNGNWGNRGNGNGNVDNPSGRELPLLPELADALRGSARIDGIQLGVTLSTSANLQAVPLISAGAMNSAGLAAQASRNQLAGWPGGTAPGSAPVNYVQGADRGGTVAAGVPATALGAARADSVALSFAQAAGAVAQAALNNQHGNEGVPPPPPMPWLDGTRPALVTTPTAWQPLPQGLPPAGWSVAAAAVDGNEAKLQIMALLMAQLGQAAVGAAGAANVQTPGFVDPQAVAAQAAAMRAGRNIDLGAGRSLQFTLVQDRMRRVGAVGEEERAAAGCRPDAEVKSARERRAGEAEESEENRDRREQGRRRRAAEAAMRRRRRKLSTRCRLRRGPRMPLREPGQGRYPQAVDWAEFRGRLPPRYLWGSAPETP